MQPQRSIELVTGRGVAGDRYQLGIEQGFYSRRPEPGRQVTLFEAEVLDLLARDHGIALAPAEHRRNITTRGVALAPLVGQRLRVGDCLLEATRLSVPCGHLDEILGRRVYDALVNRAGLNCVIVRGGTVRIGDPVARG